MGIGQNLVNFFNNVNGQNFTVRFAGKFVSAVRSSDGNSQSVDMSFLNKSFGFVRVGNQTFLVNNAFGTVTVFLVAFAGFQRTDDAEFAFDGSADGMSAGDDFAGNFYVVFIGRGRFAVSFQRPVHHNRRIAVNNGRLADIDRRTVVLMDTNRQFGEHFDTGRDHMAYHRIAGKLAGTGRSLQDNRGIDFFSGLQNSQNLLHIINVKSRNTVSVLGGMVKNLTHCY